VADRPGRGIIDGRLDGSTNGVRETAADAQLAIVVPDDVSNQLSLGLRVEDEGEGHALGVDRRAAMSAKTCSPGIV
jgi:hypothetical protein